MRYAILAAVVIIIAYAALQPVVCHKVWSDNHIASRFGWTGCQINEGHGWKSEWLYRSDDIAMPALRQHFHSANFGGYAK